jgi:hypothetical protein
VEFLTPSIRPVTSLTDRALNDLRVSRHCLWMGNPHRIFEHCAWRSNGRLNAHTLQWKAGSSDKPVGSSSNAIIGFVGLVVSEGTSMSPDAGWQVSINACAERQYVLTLVNSLVGAKTNYISRSTPSESLRPELNITSLVCIGITNGKAHACLSKTAVSYLLEVSALWGTASWSRTSVLCAFDPPYLR